jgi:hypothetical protein
MWVPTESIANVIKRVLISALASLESHTEEIRWSPDGADVKHEYALFAQSGVTQSVRDAAADRDDLQLSDLEQIVDPSASQ